MNPIGGVIVILGLLLIILGVKGSYTALETKLTGKPHQVPTTTSTTPAATTGTTPTPSRNIAPGVQLA